MTTEPPITRRARRSVDDVSWAANLAFETLDRFPNITNLKELRHWQRWKMVLNPIQGSPDANIYSY